MLDIELQGESQNSLDKRAKREAMSCGAASEIMD
jgi:hypothetical protein